MRTNWNLNLLYQCVYISLKEVLLNYLGLLKMPWRHASVAQLLNGIQRFLDFCDSYIQWSGQQENKKGKNSYIFRLSFSLYQTKIHFIYTSQVSIQIKTVANYAIKLKKGFSDL